MQASAYAIHNHSSVSSLSRGQIDNWFFTNSQPRRSYQGYLSRGISSLTGRDDPVRLTGLNQSVSKSINHWKLIYLFTCTSATVSGKKLFADQETRSMPCVRALEKQLGSYTTVCGSFHKVSKSTRPKPSHERGPFSK